MIFETRMVFSDGYATQWLPCSPERFEQMVKHGFGRHPLTGTTYEGRVLVCAAKALTVGGEFKVMPD